MSGVETLRVENSEIHGSIGVAFGIGLLPQMRGPLVISLKLLVIPAQSRDGRNKPLRDTTSAPSHTHWLKMYIYAFKRCVKCNVKYISECVFIFIAYLFVSIKYK